MSIPDPVAHPRVVTREEWLTHRRELLAEEKAHTREYDRINAKRRRLPMVLVDKEYMFDTPAGTQSLFDLFAGKRQLIVQHVMFGPDWEKCCPGCTSFVDALSDIGVLESRDAKFILVSRAPLAKLQSFAAEKGWDFEWVSSFGSDFNYDFHVTLDESVTPPVYNYKDAPERSGEMPGTSVFLRVGDQVFHTYSCFARAGERMTDAYSILDITPYGRQQDFEDSPEGWPQNPTYG